MEKRRSIDHPVVPFRITRGMFAKLKLLLKIAKRIGYSNRASYKNVVHRGLESLEYDLRRHCEQTGQDFNRIVELTSGGGAGSDAPIGNIDDGDGI